MAAARHAHRYDRSFALSSDLLRIASSDGCFIEVNGAWERTLGWTRADLRGRSFLDLATPTTSRRPAPS